MKRLFLCLSLLLLITAAQAQTVIHGSDIIDNKLQDGYYMLLKVDDKTLAGEWNSFLGNYGKVTNTDKNRYAVSSFKEMTVSRSSLSLNSKVSDFKDFTKIFCVIDNVPKDFNEDAFNKVLHTFAEKANYNELIRLAQEDLTTAQSLLKDNQRDQKQLERSIENNLKQQQKYGKVLDESPDKIVGLIEEKQELLDKQSTADAADAAALQQIQKASQQKEKEIQKNKKNQDKYSKKLQKTEKEYNDLKDKLMTAVSQVDLSSRLVAAKEATLKHLKK